MCNRSVTMKREPYFRAILFQTVKVSAYNVGDLGLIPGLGRSPLEKEMATHSSILVWKIPWMDGGAW